jgi:hypothetical protein
LRSTSENNSIIELLPTNTMGIRKHASSHSAQERSLTLLWRISDAFEVRAAGLTILGFVYRVAFFKRTATCGLASSTFRETAQIHDLLTRRERNDRWRLAAARDNIRLEDTAFLWRSGQ